VAQIVKEVRPDAVLSANAPLDTQKLILRAAVSQGARFYIWLQDIYSAAITSILQERFGFLGRLIGRYYKHLELGMLKRSDGIVAISEDFLKFLHEHGIITPCTVIENWACLDSFDTSDRNHSCRECHRFRFVYSGTLGYKHDPELLLLLAEQPGAQVHVYTEGPAAEFLRREAAKRGLLSDIQVAGWVPFNRLPEILGGADALVAMVGRDAGVYSVPSKVLSYLCTGKPLLLSVPSENLAARIVRREKAGLIASPECRDEFLAGASRLMADPQLCASLGRAGLAFARRTFDIQRITDRFERVLVL
jgi:glycosyltransferase involved in cell wall biosynthesis